ncbi:MAG: hypothetical protein HFH93_02015 [Lachnospiraceae bacterium]|nr:hypothetical protein [Lachnospiraceae bacterium]
MGVENEAMLSYLEDNYRFADLFNQLYFGGGQVVNPEELAEASEVYHGKPGEKSGRTRDVKKRLKSGRELKILAVESQSEASGIMPWRVMDYDCREYGRQIQQAQRANEARERTGEKVYESAGERLDKVRKEERFAPVYTLCLYHGTEPWDGPRSLKDMMDFGESRPGQPESSGTREWEECFADYPLHLVCVNESLDCSGFRTSLRDLFTILPCRRDKKRLMELLSGDPAYQSMDKETAQTLGVLMGINKFNGNEETYKTEGGNYNMCQAIRELMEDSRLEGEARERIEIIENIMKLSRCSLKEACKAAGKTLEEYRQAKKIYTKI